MEATLFSRTRTPKPSLPRPRINKRRLCNSPILAVLTRPTAPENCNQTDRTGSKPADDMMRSVTTKTIYNDSWFDRAAIKHLSKNVQHVTGLRNGKSGYESLVQASAEATERFDAITLRELVVEALHRAVPRPILGMIQTLLPQSRFKREIFATFTTMFFVWLVGPCEVRESEFNGRKEKNVVHVKKCRFLEESNCVGMCANMCKVPTQAFIKDSMGMPMTMVPNYDDMSCEMIYGQDPPALAEDPVFKQPCYKLCKSKQNHKMECAV